MRGDADSLIYPNVGTSLWDVGPGTVMIQALGGHVSGIRGEQYPYSNSTKTEDIKINYGLLVLNNHHFVDKLVQDFKSMLTEIGQGEGVITGL